MKKGFPIQTGKETWKELEAIRNRGFSYFFTDWLDMILCSLLALTENHMDALAKQDINEISKGKYNDKYMEIIKKYSEGKIGERAIDHFANAFKLLITESRESKKDVLGEIFQAQITYGEHGQFFTPEHVSDFMSKIVMPEKCPNDNSVPEKEVQSEPETIMDPCCGSGRFLLGAAKENPDNYFIGQDIDERCCKMAAINLFIFDLNGEIRWGDSLANKINKCWIIRKGGFIFEDGGNQSQTT
jgi:type I restriction-modification system DNA methylase subunit